MGWGHLLAKGLGMAMAGGLSAPRPCRCCCAGDPCPSSNMLATTQLLAAAVVVAAIFLASSSSFSIYICICQWACPSQLVLLWGCDEIVLRFHHILRVPSTSDLCPCHGGANLGWPPWATGCSRGWAVRVGVAQVSEVVGTWAPTPKPFLGF